MTPLLMREGRPHDTPFGEITQHFSAGKSTFMLTYRTRETQKREPVNFSVLSDQRDALTMIFFLRFFLRNVNSSRNRLSLGHTTYPQRQHKQRTIHESIGLVQFRTKHNQTKDLNASLPGHVSKAHLLIHHDRNTVMRDCNTNMTSLYCSSIH